MCKFSNQTNTMVTPTKSNKFPGQKKSHGSYGGVIGGNKTPHKQRKTPSPTSSDYYSNNCFKTPQNKPLKADLSRCASEPMRMSRRSVTPVHSSTGGSPLNFAGPKCLEPPTPMSLPRPPTTWTRPPAQPELPTARIALSFEDDLDGKGTFEESLSQQLKMLLKVQA